MSTTAPPSAAPGSVTDPMRRTARAAGVLYLITFVSVPTLALYQTSREQPDFVLGVGSETGVLWGALPRSSSPWPASARPWCCTRSRGGRARRPPSGSSPPASWRAASSSSASSACSRCSPCGTTSPALLAPTRPRCVTAGHALTAIYNWTFLLSQSLMPVFNALCLGYVLYRSGLVPRLLPAVGLVGAPLLLASDLAIFFGVYDRMAPIAALAALPIAAWEFSLGVYLIVKGFRPAAVAALPR